MVTETSMPVIDWAHDPLVRPAVPIPLPDPMPVIPPPDRHQFVARLRQLQATLRTVLQVEVDDGHAA